MLRSPALLFAMPMCPLWANLEMEWCKQCRKTNFCFRRVAPSLKISLKTEAKFHMNIAFIKPALVIKYCITNLSENLTVLGCLSNFMKFQSFMDTVSNNVINRMFRFICFRCIKNSFLDKISAIVFIPVSYSNLKSNS